MHSVATFIEHNNNRPEIHAVYTQQTKGHFYVFVLSIISGNQNVTVDNKKQEYQKIPKQMKNLIHHTSATIILQIIVIFNVHF